MDDGKLPLSYVRLQVLCGLREHGIKLNPRMSIPIGMVSFIPFSMPQTLYLKVGAFLPMKISSSWSEHWVCLRQTQMNWIGEAAGQVHWCGKRKKGPDWIFNWPGYYTPYMIMQTPGYRFMGAYGFYWTSTKDESKNGEYYFYRKLYYESDQVYRQSIENNAQYLSLRLVRNAQWHRVS